ncbi:hypothetical protein NDU88_010597 [Pleurodeles waltl]|uniref:Uncharacterized protein n=1 Tax=Pleurodeles waltl TaxID=8319 RepID=A0AAV7PW06_PLEWA|nr:hypothetical protein NDU88_010597 [Pleurodeles waltl]
MRETAGAGGQSPQSEDPRASQDGGTCRAPVKKPAAVQADPIPVGKLQRAPERGDCPQTEEQVCPAPCSSVGAKDGVHLNIRCVSLLTDTRGDRGQGGTHRQSSQGGITEAVSRTTGEHPDLHP